MTVVEDRLDATFAALADPTRRAILARLATGDATVNELAAPFDMTLPGISKHLRVLEQCGLISRSRRAQFRPCHLEREPLDAAAGWIEANRRHPAPASSPPPPSPTSAAPAPRSASARPTSPTTPAALKPGPVPDLPPTALPST